MSNFQVSNQELGYLYDYDWFSAISWRKASNKFQSSPQQLAVKIEKPISSSV